MEAVPFRGAESGVVGLPEHRQELRPLRLGSIGHPLQRGVQRELGRQLMMLGSPLYPALAFHLA